MVDAIPGFSPATFLDTVKGKTTPVTPAKPTTPVSNSNVTSTDSVGPTDIVSVLQDINSKTQKSGGISDLISSASTASSDPLSGVYNSLMQTKSNIAPLQQLQNLKQQVQGDADGDGADGPDVDTNPVQSAITTLHAGSNAYNKVLQQNAQAVLNSSKGLIA